VTATSPARMPFKTVLTSALPFEIKETKRATSPPEIDPLSVVTAALSANCHLL
jgi:hypothetical protein